MGYAVRAASRFKRQSSKPPGLGIRGGSTPSKKDLMLRAEREQKLMLDKEARQKQSEIEREERAEEREIGREGRKRALSLEEAKAKAAQQKEEALAERERKSQTFNAMFGPKRIPPDHLPEDIADAVINRRITPQDARVYADQARTGQRGPTQKEQMAQQIPDKYRVAFMNDEMTIGQIQDAVAKDNKVATEQEEFQRKQGREMQGKTIKLQNVLETVQRIYNRRGWAFDPEEIEDLLVAGMSPKEIVKDQEDAKDEAAKAAKEDEHKQKRMELLRTIEDQFAHRKTPDSEKLARLQKLRRAMVASEDEQEQEDAAFIYKNLTADGSISIEGLKKKAYTKDLAKQIDEEEQIMERLGDKEQRQRLRKLQENAHMATDPEEKRKAFAIVNAMFDFGYRTKIDNKLDELMARMRSGDK